MGRGTTTTFLLLSVVCFSGWKIVIGAETNQCLVCRSVDIKNGDGGAPVLPSGLKKDEACIDGAASVDFKQCNVGEGCMTVTAAITATANLTNNADSAATANSTTQDFRVAELKEINYVTVIRGCYDTDVSHGDFCSHNDGKVFNASLGVVQALDKVPDLKVKKVDGRVCFCDGNLCNAQKCLFKILKYCAQTWHVALAVCGVFLLLVIFICCKCRTRCFCKNYTRVN